MGYKTPGGSKGSSVEGGGADRASSEQLVSGQRLKSRDKTCLSSGTQDSLRQLPTGSMGVSLLDRPIWGLQPGADND